MEKKTTVSQMSHVDKYLYRLISADIRKLHRRYHRDGMIFTGDGEMTNEEILDRLHTAEAAADSIGFDFRQMIADAEAAHGKLPVSIF